MKMIKQLNSILNTKQKMKIAGLLVLILIGGLLETLGITMILPLLNAITDMEKFQNNKYVLVVQKVFHIENASDLILIMIVALITIFVIKNLYLLLLYYLQGKFINHTRYKMSKNLLALYLDKPYEFFLNAETPVILQTIYGDMDNVFNLLLQCMNLATECIVAFCICIIILCMDFKMTIIMVILLLVATLFVSIVLKKKMNYLGDAVRKEQSGLYKWVLQSITGVKEVKTFQKQNYFTKQYSSSAQKYALYQTQNNVLSNSPRLLIETVAIIGILLYVLFTLLSGNDLKNMIGLIGAFGIAAVRLLPSVNRINTFSANISYFQPALDYIYHNIDIEELKRRVKNDNESVRDMKTYPIKLTQSIELKDSTYSYPNSDVKILDKANMSIPVGKSIGIMGGSGAGKTTLVDILLGLLQTNSGTINCDNQNLEEHKKEWLANVGYIPQNIYMLDASIRNNVAFGVEEEDISDLRVWEVLKEAQLTEYVEGLENGIYSQIGERGIRISGGQKQRLGIARALYHNPEILIFDEATSALDTDTESAIMEAVEKLHGQKTMIIIAHRLRTIEKCDIIYEVSNGKIIKK